MVVIMTIIRELATMWRKW